MTKIVDSGGCIVMSFAMLKNSVSEVPEDCGVQAFNTAECGFRVGRVCNQYSTPCGNTCTTGTHYRWTHMHQVWGQAAHILRCSVCEGMERPKRRLVWTEIIDRLHISKYMKRYLWSFLPLTCVSIALQQNQLPLFKATMHKCSQ